MAVFGRHKLKHVNRGLAYQAVSLVYSSCKNGSLALYACQIEASSEVFMGFAFINIDIIDDRI
ncbi:MAG: hypothetical protein M0Z41_11535 [Peptococcaceae bacterium]|jgi:hypothetical protein|nr:hypothetical protein [Peptococcaceae bacterium]